MRKDRPFGTRITALGLAITLLAAALGGCAATPLAPQSASAEASSLPESTGLEPAPVKDPSEQSALSIMLPASKAAFGDALVKLAVHDGTLDSLFIFYIGGAWFHLSGYLNSQNSSFWSAKNRIKHSKPRCMTQKSE